MAPLQFRPQSGQAWRLKTRQICALLTSTHTQTSPLLDHHCSRSRSRSPSTPPRSPFHSPFGDGVPFNLWDHVLPWGPETHKVQKWPAARRRARLFQSHRLTGPPCTKRHLPLRPPAEEFSRILLSLRDFSCPRILSSHARPIPRCPRPHRRPRLVIVFLKMSGCLADELLAQAEANGYSQGAHTEQDQVRGKGKYGKKAPARSSLLRGPGGCRRSFTARSRTWK